MREATFPAMAEHVVQYVRYTGRNIEQIKQFCDISRVFVSDDGKQTLFLDNIGEILMGDFLVKDEVLYNSGAPEISIYNKALFPALVKEDIPIDLDEYLLWENELMEEKER